MFYLLLAFIPALMLLLFAALSLFWLYMLVKAATSDSPDKWIWVIIILFTHFVGALVYALVANEQPTKPPARTITSSKPKSTRKATKRKPANT